ncbi:hypothetical protein ACFL3S_13550 [Gemmatimonadota bacterium]
MKAEPTTPRCPEDGIALITTLLVILVAGALIIGAIAIGSNHLLVDRYWKRHSNLDALADGGVEKGLAVINGDKTLYPDSGFVALEAGAPVTDGNGDEIPGVSRWVYAGPSGITSGQYGVFGSVVSVVRDAGGGVSIRRQQVFQESFAKYAYFTDNEGGNIYFASGDQIWGPLHTNDQIKIHSSGATFHDEVTTAKDVYHAYYGTFDKGYSEYTTVIPMPETADLMKLQVQAQAGNTAFVGDTQGADGEATTRIEFIAVDLNQDGDETDEDEGFIRVYQSSNFRWVSAKPQPRQSCYNHWYYGWICNTVTDLVGAQNCGDYHGGQFVSAPDHDPVTHGHDGLYALKTSSRRCWLGGADEIWGQFTPADSMGGQWLPWGGGVDSRLQALRPDDANYLFPITRPLNPDFKGVIFVDGKVIVSGRIRGRVTVAATGNIIFGDDITYVTDPGAGTCEDVAGYFSGAKIVMSNNGINAATQPASGESYRNYDESNGEFFHGVVLALDVFTAEQYTSGSTSAQYCESQRSGRGCIYLTGGIIQNTRGAVGLTDGHGYVKRYSYDICARTNPPPYFPTTGVFVRGQYYEVDPAGFSISSYFGEIAPGG